jgi:hypothetical protein
MGMMNDMFSKEKKEDISSMLQMALPSDQKEYSNPQAGLFLDQVT